ncbi:MAG TPA: DUF819 family protein [Phycisphaerae bacterium]|nr:DUF819 family protein [Phycisphaerae bacterium]
MLATAGEQIAQQVTVTDPAGVLAVLLVALALIFGAMQHPVLGRIFKVIPALIFCYFVPTALATAKIIPHDSPLYDWIKDFVLPASLLLLVLAVDLPGIIRLGPKAIVMMLTGTAGVVIGGPLALLICRGWLPPDAWRGMAALSGSWIGGGANFVAMGKAANASDAMIALMVVPDVLVANIWMAVLLFFAGKQEAIDRWTGANTRGIDDLRHRLAEFQERSTRPSTIGDLLMILALGFGGAYASYVLGKQLDGWLSRFDALSAVTSVISAGTWKYILVTTIGLVLSFTPVRNLEGAGASRMGSVFLYLLVACIGAHASFEKAWEYRALIGMGFIWMAVHAGLLLLVGRLIRAPIFYVAVGSQANIGGAASAPIVASAFHPALAPVGALLAVLGYVLGTYCGLLCLRLLMLVAGVAHV